MDDFLDLYLNLEQVRSWAETRNAEAVRFAAIPKQGKPKGGSEIASWCFHAASTLAKNGRDIGAELWAASGWTPPSHIFVLPPMAQKVAEDIGFPLYLGLFNKDIQIHPPKRAHTDALLALWVEALDSERALMVDLAQTYSKNGDGFRSDPRLGQYRPNCARSRLTISRRRSRTGRLMCSSGERFRRYATLSAFFRPAP
jgi:hypothetical protein